MRLRRLLGLVVVVSAFGAGAEGAAATTFCVPTFHAACPSNGTNVAEADLEKAMGLQDSDGIADQVVIAAGTYLPNGNPAGGGADTFEPHGTDPLTVTGAGPAATVLTSNGTGNIFVVNLHFNNGRTITMRDLTVRVPASFPNGSGAALQLGGDILDNVDVVSHNPSSNGVASTVGPGNVFRNGETRGELGGSVRTPICVCNPGGSLLVEDSTLTNPAGGLVVESGGNLTARRVRVVNATVYGANVSGGSATVENSAITLAEGVAFSVEAEADNSSIAADHVTVLNTGPSDPAMEIQKTSGVGNASLTVSNSILRGFASGYYVQAAAAPGIGTGTLTVRHSNFQNTGTVGGLVDVATGNIDADPLLLPDLSLPPGSPSIDAGDPGAGLTADILGTARPLDGNGDGIVRRDQGAFEYRLPAVVVDPGTGGGGGGNGGGGTPDTTAPQTTIARGPGKDLARGKAKFSFKSSEAGARFECKLDGRKISACKSPKRYNGLKPGRHTFKAWAIDAAGNKDPTPAKRRFRVPAAE